MDEFGFTEYFLHEVLRKRPYLRKKYCTGVVKNPLRVQQQEGNRWRFWGRVKELDNRIVRVVTLSDKRTIHNAFLDRGYRP
jgi:hypothetical protein